MVLVQGKGELRIENPRLWWVNGLGEQPLYKVTAILYRQGQEEDRWERRIGLRSMRMKREKDKWGESFAHEINGQDFFAMGADYIPEEHLLGRRSREKTRRLLEDCKAAHFNVIRVWGGGLYPDDWFYDICDELGLAVWQDFMFACSVYELTPEFEENIRQELIENVKRIRHHACLALWCGNNEMEMFVDERCWVTKYTEVRDYLFMYERIFPEILREYDPDTFYWPASPSSGGYLTSLTTRTGEMCIIGRCGTETVLSLSTGNISSAMPQSLASRLCLRRKHWKLSQTGRRISTCFPISWKSIRETMGQTERL